MAQGWNMDKERQLHLAEAFRTRHQAPHLLLLANAWDALSARIVEEAGFDAVATTSGGVSWVLGYADGEAAPWSEVVAATARMARVLRERCERHKRLLELLRTKLPKA
jgi:2-methylisocitrate lyase-like PEP mutase family enzyme